jgi:metal-responsive CopG/Arc/MetJ family transcriptional regulator
MATVKVTFTLDESTVAKLNQTAERLSKPKSEVVREAIQDFHARSDRLSEAERQRMVGVMKRILARAPDRTQADVDRELREIRRARRSGGRLHPAE